MITKNEMSLKRKGLIWAIIARFAVVALFFDALIPLFPQISGSYNLRDNDFQILLGLCFIIFAIFQLISASIINAFGLYKICSFSCLYVTIAVLSLCVVRDLHIFVIVFLSIFAANSVGSNATRVALRNSTTSEEYKKLFAWVSGIVEIKQVTMPLLTGILIGAFGWRWALVGTVMPVLFVGIWIELANKYPDARSAIAPSLGFGSWKIVALKRSFLFPTLIASAYQISFNCLSSKFPFMLSNEFNISPSIVGFILSIASGIVALGLFISGYIAPKISTVKMVIIGTSIMSIGALVIALGYHAENRFTIMGIVIVQFALGFIIVPCSADAIDVPEECRPQASALFGFVQSVIGGISVALVGALQASQMTGAILVTMASIFVICLLMVIQSIVVTQTMLKN